MHQLSCRLHPLLISPAGSSPPLPLPPRRSRRSFSILSGEIRPDFDPCSCVEEVLGVTSTPHSFSRGGARRGIEGVFALHRLMKGRGEKSKAAFSPYTRLIFATSQQGARVVRACQGQPVPKVMFPVLQNIPFKRLDRTVRHYFLLVLNLREERFEVLDSMRSLSDPNLENCGNKLMTAIKKVWRIHYPNSRKIINNYQLIDIQVPLQTNNHDCGFHMLMHCEHWNGNNMQEFNKKDIPILRKILTYKCLSHPDNNIAWKCMMKNCSTFFLLSD